MAMTVAEMDAKMDEHFGFEARDDVDGVLSTLAEDVRHDIVGWPEGPATSRASARKFYETLFADLADGRVTTIRRLYGERFLVDESRWEGRAVGTPFGLAGAGRPLSFRMLHVVEFGDDEQLSSEQVWLDMSAIFAQLA